ncbi:MAG: ferritin family protein [Spirochaetales bacterium]|nr:ferritin family protein [Spirochaetales bacterium]
MAQDIFDFAMKMEKEGEVFYRESSGKVKDQQAVKLLFLLANEEKRHYELVKTYKEGLAGVMYTAFLKEVKTVFSEMKASDHYLDEDKATLMDILDKALKLEDKSVQLYKAEAEKTDNKELKEILLLLKKEEDAHYSLISSWIEYYGRPAQWLEQAEFTQLEDY